ncbi:hypothetical protein DSM03_11619 [Leeuwenhoekiella aestuarii]|uniref:hypothetical protein n=1 Tax=Leeuwenhoekiella aestuarii TaxID=2249426 RepID=UPI000FFE5D14|nr:hypothetical protein [Leeuwenhoekiella aestuarii]RXG11488.1 hypothetical protein DSM03_11619 [Leeuwenhoekiella aestuarii]
MNLRKYSTIFLILKTFLSFSQLYNSSDKVGVGTTTPQKKFEVEEGMHMKLSLGVQESPTGSLEPSLFISRWRGTGNTYDSSIIHALRSENYYGLAFSTLSNHLDGDFSSYKTKMYLTQAGNLGIGTINPVAKLDVEGGDFHLGKEVSSNGQRRLLRIYGFDSDRQFFGSIQSNWEDARRTFDIYTSSFTNQIKIDASANPDGRIVMLPGDNVGVSIGTLTMGPHKLAVEGSIGAREVKVQANGWSDFVFQKDYNLPTLEEVSNHIAQKGHLKDIPSAAEVEKEGIFLGEMDSKLLQKIEELTLYILEQDKVNKKQAILIEKLEKRINKFENQ